MLSLNDDFLEAKKQIHSRLRSALTTEWEQMTSFVNEYKKKSKEYEKQKETCIKKLRELFEQHQVVCWENWRRVAQYYEEVGKANYEFQYIIKSAGEEDRVNVDMRALRSLLRG
ncbi:3086_t:CDS:2 [Paraglomus brasilianum]|uniref:3086_t:CDS:1 n=1 Tax=Paraglomus brasilianum TaxID=144538 RepID=A0A9N9C8A0_9GLOM|nr:3086_t:CDS:2 [Paraglomus brasilianum]